MQRLFVSVALLWLTAVGPSTAQSSNRDIWLQAVEQHTPGTWDAAAESVSAWPSGQLDGILRGLPLGRNRPAGMNETLVRAAVLHADIAMYPPAGYFRPITPRSSPPARRVLLDDGRLAGSAMPSPDWAFARRLLDALDPAPADHEAARLWYRATLAWMARYGDVAQAARHLDRAVAIFPNDREILFARGWLHETFASPPTRAMVASLREAQRPAGRWTPGQIADVPPLSEALEEADKAFGAALEADERFAEARIHRARVAHLSNRTDEAEVDLRRALGEAREPFLIYMAALLLGRTLESSGDYAGALEAYERAFAEFPYAQSARLGRSRTESLLGRRAQALEQLRVVITLPENHPLRDDPWWTYQIGPGRHADERFAELHAAVGR